ncbi:MAG: esterase family protein [Treponema sp.]|nr:esterase family protein [Treponema sp.]
MIFRGNISSHVLNMQTGISVLVPDTSKGTGPYRTVYLLHGLHGNHDSMLDNTMLPFFAKEYHALFIMPEVGRSFYTDMQHGLKLFTYISEELPEICGKVFNLSGKREDTAVMGYSMGGYGALKVGLTKPERFGFCGAISSACLFLKGYLDGLREDPSLWLKTGGPDAEAVLRDFYTIYGDDLRWTPDNEIIELVKKVQTAPVKPRIYAACGIQDELHDENIRFQAAMQQFDFDFTYEEWPGIHDWQFFNDGLKKALQKWYT